MSIGDFLLESSSSQSQAQIRKSFRTVVLRGKAKCVAWECQVVGRPRPLLKRPAVKCEWQGIINMFHSGEDIRIVNIM